MLNAAKPANAASGAIPFTVKSVGTAQSNAPVFTGIPFPPGELRNAEQLDLVYDGQSIPRQVKVLSTYPDGSLRVVLMGFRATVASGQTLSASVRYGGASGPGLSPTISWVRNLKVIAMCAPQWYGRTGVFNMRFAAADDNTLAPEFEERLRTRFVATSDPPSHSHPDYRNYYDHVHASYMTLLRGRAPDSAPRLIWEEVNQYRENEILHTGAYAGQYHAGSRTGNSYPMPPDLVRRTYLLGLLEDYYFTGDARSLAVATEIGAALLRDASLTTSRFTISERLVGFALMGLCAMYEQNLDPQYLAAAKSVAKVAMDHQDAMAAKYPNQAGMRGLTGAFVHDKNGRWDDPSESRESGCGSPWMSGVLSEAMGRLYWLTGDARVKQSVVRVANWAATAGFIAGSDPDNSSRMDALWYICKSSDNSEIYPALSPMTFYMFGFAYQVTGDPRYLAVTKRLLTANNSWGRTIKEFNQAMRSASQGLYLLQMEPGSVPLTLAESGGGSGTPATPGIPSNLAATAGDRRVGLTWIAGSGAAPSGFHVYRSNLQAGSYSRITTNPLLTPTYLDTAVQNDITYWYRVGAVNSAGVESEHCAPVNATPVAPVIKTYTVSGQVTSGGEGLAGVLIAGGGQSAVTNAAGSYTLSGLLSGTHTITASNEAYTLSAAQSVVVNTNRTGVNFTATPVALAYTISGQVTSAGVGLAGVSVVGGGQSAITNAAGNYTLNGLPAGTYTVTPSKAGYTFSAAESVTVAPDRTGVNFTATLDAPVVTNLVIYGDAVRTRWRSLSRKAKISLAEAKTVSEGKKSISLTVTGVDGYVELTGEGLAVAGKQYLKFSVHGGKKGRQALRIRSIVDGVKQANSLNLSHYGGAPSANGWKHYSIPLADLKATSGNLTGVKFFAGKKQAKVCIDYIHLQ